MTVYFSDGAVTLHHGRSEDILPTLGVCADVCVTDPPYGETSLAWDRWPKGWPSLVAAALPSVTSLWCFGSMRMFLEQRDEFVGWRFAQDVIWEKPNGSGASDGRFLRVHENVAHWYRGQWADVPRESQREHVYSVDKSMRRPAGANSHRRADRQTVYADDSTRLVRSVMRRAQMRYQERHPTEKPAGIIDPLIAYSCLPGGTVLDVFAGSGSVLDAARCSGRKAIGIEADERFCEVTATRLAQGSLFGAAS